MLGEIGVYGVSGWMVGSCLMAGGTGCYDLLCLGVLNNVVVVLLGGGVYLRVLAGFHCCVVGAWTWWLDRCCWVLWWDRGGVAGLGLGGGSCYWCCVGSWCVWDWAVEAFSCVAWIGGSGDLELVVGSCLMAGGAWVTHCCVCCVAGRLTCFVMLRVMGGIGVV